MSLLASGFRNGVMEVSPESIKITALSKFMVVTTCLNKLCFNGFTIMISILITLISLRSDIKHWHCSTLFQKNFPSGYPHLKLIIKALILKYLTLFNKRRIITDKYQDIVSKLCFFHRFAEKNIPVISTVQPGIDLCNYLQLKYIPNYVFSIMPKTILK